MRLYLLPISTRRVLIYCQRLNVTTKTQQTLVDKATTRAANLWASWEKKESGWQRKVVDYGNSALKRIPYEEWGLKSIPPLSTRRKEEELLGMEQVEVQFPSSLIPESKVPEVMKTLGTERQGLHRKRMIYCFLGMPITAPIAILPVIPNLPFFYLVFRAWSHWRAWAGSKHIEYLVDKKFLTMQPSQILDQLYASGKEPFNSHPTSIWQEGEVKDETVQGETIVLPPSAAKTISQALEMPELAIELDRAVWQVEKALEAEKQEQAQKTKSPEASGQEKEK